MSVPSAREPVAPRLRPALQVLVRLGPLIDLGRTAGGHRRTVPIVGGSVTGAFEAEVLEGADRQIVRDDGAVEVSAAYTLRTASGALVEVASRGVRSGSPAVLEAVLAGADVDPADYYFRLAIRLETADAELAWVQDRIFVASAVRTADTVRYDAYELL